MTVTAPVRPSLLDAEPARQAMAAEVCETLRRRPREVPSKYLYDQRGCELFDRITQLPEYYLSRSESEILRTRGEEIVRAARPESIVELGAGFCTKTRLLLAAARRVGGLEYFVASDVSPVAVDTVSALLPLEFPGLRVHGAVVEFEDVEQLPRFGRQMVIFLGSTIGNLNGRARARFLRRIRSLLHVDDSFLLGVDLVKDAREIDSAYNDSAGVTAAFTHNLLDIMNRELGADFDPDGFEHYAAYHPRRHRVEIYLKSLTEQVVNLPACDVAIRFRAGELLRTEISVKFERKSLSRELRAAGLSLRGWFTDDANRFALALATPIPRSE